MSEVYFEDNIIRLQDRGNNQNKSIKELENYKNNCREKHYNYNNNNYNHSPDNEAVDESVMDAYFDTFGRKCPRFIQRQLVMMHEAGYQWDFLRAVLEYTAAAPSPSWAYAQSVISSYDASTTEGKFYDSIMRYRELRAARYCKPSDDTLPW